MPAGAFWPRCRVAARIGRLAIGSAPDYGWPRCRTGAPTRADRPRHRGAPRPLPRRRRRRRRARHRDPLAPRLGAGRPDGVARGRRAAPHHRPRRRRPRVDAARVRPAPRRPRARRALLRARLRLRGRAAGARRGGQPARLPRVAVPYDTPFIAITKAAFAHLANEELERVTQALEVQERLAQAVLDGRGVQALLAILCERLRVSLALVDESGRVIGERHAGRRLSFDGALELPVVAHGETAILRVARERESLSRLRPARAAPRPDRARLRALAPPRRVGGRAPARRRPARGPRARPARRARRLAAHLRVRPRPRPALRGAARRGRRRAPRPSACARRSRASSTAAGCSTSPPRGATAPRSCSRPRARRTCSSSRRRSSTAEPSARVGVGRPGTGRDLGRSLLEARAALDAGAGRIASYRDLGSLELLLGLPDAALEAFVDRVLGPVARSGAARRLAPRPARLGLPLERGGRPARRPPAHAPLPHGAPRGADRAPSRPPRRADGAVARGQGGAGAPRPRERPRARRGSRAEPAKGTQSVWLAVYERPFRRSRICP